MTEKVVLIACVGMSPAVLTETVWALAQENPPVVPDEVVVITTVRGKKDIREKLLDSGEWRRLRELLGYSDKLRFGADSSIQILGDGVRDFDDVMTAGENEAAADFMLRTVRQYTEDPSCRIIASIAGGRKTMSALMLSCMSLLGRELDRVCHVLANDDFIRSRPDFLFPENPGEVEAAAVQLADLPFVRVRGLYEKTMGEAPSSYSVLVARLRKALPPAVVELPVVFYRESHQLKIGERLISLSKNEFISAEAFIRDRKDKKFSSSEELASAVFPSAQSRSDEFRRFLSNARKKIRDAGFPELVDLLLPLAKVREYRYRSVTFRAGRPRTSQ